MQRLRSQAMNGRNRIPLDLLNTSELRDLNCKISLFALAEIRRQIILAKKEEPQGIIHTWVQTCGCPATRPYGLPCYHVVPTNGDAIPWHSVAPFWRLDNRDGGIQFDHSMLTISRINDEYFEDARSTMYIPNFPANNISLRDVQHASQLNNTIPFSDRLRGQLNDATRTRQSLDLQEKLAQLLEKFPSATDAAQATLLQDSIDRELNAIEQSTATQDPQELKGRRTFGRGVPRRLTAAEGAEKELAKSDKGGTSRRSANLEFYRSYRSSININSAPTYAFYYDISPQQGTLFNRWGDTLSSSLTKVSILPTNPPSNSRSNQHKWNVLLS